MSPPVTSEEISSLAIGLSMGSRFARLEHMFDNLLLF